MNKNIGRIKNNTKLTILRVSFRKINYIHCFAAAVLGHPNKKKSIICEEGLGCVKIQRRQSPSWRGRHGS